MRRAGLRIYSIHLPPPYSAAGREPEALREGFSIAAFLLTVLWALANRLWLRGAIAAAVIILALGLAQLLALNVLGQAVIVLAFMVWVGMEGNDWLRAGLARRGWREVCVIAAESEDGAIRRYADLSALRPAPASSDLPAEGPASA
ncbi:MAG: DUF2628 domain-containing protein [Alphaproteobacteria bacterium]|nr:DUF2628 domain-containing protein [Alphaproteobacteria bacterium]